MNLFHSLLFVCMFVPFSVCAQECGIPNEFHEPKALAASKVKEVSVFKGRDSLRKLYNAYWIQKNGCIERMLSYDAENVSDGPLQTTYSVSADGRTMIISQGRIGSKGYMELSSTKEEYSKSKKLMRKKSTEFGETITIKLDRYDTNDYKKNDLRIIKLMPHGDTISITSTSFDHVTRLFSIKNRSANGWEESEKVICTFKDEIPQEEKYYKNGQLIRSLGPEDLAKRSNATVQTGMPSMDPLPFDGNYKPDTSYTDDAKFSYNKAFSSKKPAKFLVVRYPMLNDDQKTDHYDVFDRKSGLIQKRLSFHPSQDLYFEYK